MYTQVFIYIFYIPSLVSPLFALVTMPKEVSDKIALIFRCSKKEQIVAAAGKISVPAVGPQRSNELQLTNIRQLAAMTAE
jgi:hypothetical protein